MKSIVVFRSAALGDFVMTVPALKILREVYPGRRIIFLTIQTTEKKTQRLVASYAGGHNSVPWVNLVMPHLVDDVVVMHSVFSWAEIKLVRQRLTGINVELCVLMLDPCAPWFGRLKKLILLSLILRGVPLYGWRGPGSLNGDRARLKMQGVLRHHVHGPLQFLSELSPPRLYKDAELCFDLRPGTPAAAWAKSWLAQYGLLGKRLVAFAPGALQAHKQWPLDAFKGLLRHLLYEYPEIAVLIMGAPKDTQLGIELCAQAPDRVFNVTGFSSISQSAALFQHVHLLVGNDGGAIHLGDAMGCKVVSIVPGIEYPDSIEPWHNKDLAIRLSIECAPCYSFTFCPLAHQRCMRDISVDAVLKKCRSVLKQ